MDKEFKFARRPSCELVGQVSGRDPPTFWTSERPVLSLIKHCDVCQFRDRCKSEALEKDDLSLFGESSPRKLPRSHAKGIFSVNQLSYTFRVRRRPKHLRDRPNPYYHALAGAWLAEKEVYILTRPTIPDATTRVYLDMEGDMNARSIYLIGALVVANGTPKFHSYWADQPSEEDVLFDSLRDLSCWPGWSSRFPFRQL